MLVTDRFVYLHQPKTGGTFVADSVIGLHQARGDRVLRLTLPPGGDGPAPEVPAGSIARVMVDGRNQHGRRRDIPKAWRDRALAATIRHPLSRYVSQFDFAWWRTLPDMFGPVADVRRDYPHYPDISFADFVHLTNTRSLHVRCEDDARTPGFQTQQFVECFAREPEQTLGALCGTASLARWKPEFDEIRFLDQAALASGLAGFLLEMGYTDAEADAVRNAGRLRPADDEHPASGAWQAEQSAALNAPVQRLTGDTASQDDWRKRYTPDLLAFVQHRERMLFELFPEFA